MLYRLDADGQTLVAHQPPKGLGCVLYWGAALPQDEDLTALLDGTAMDVTGGMMDEIAPLSVCPEVARGWPGQPGMILHDDAGRPVYPVFSGEIRQEVAQDSGARGLEIIGIDADHGITYRAQFQLRAGQLLAQAFLSFDKAPYVVTWLAAPVVPMPTGSDAVIDYTGR
ncbi:MAG: alpha-galactosidase, partial [Pseudomonadota bacterium]|nr:alpha-galactosidase [Pseudomonadota bacterium]